MWSERQARAAVLIGALGCAGAAPPSPAPTAPVTASPTGEPTMKPAITEQTTAGLRPEHAGAVPLLDRVDVPARGPQQVRRTYVDGAQYLLTADGPAPAWVAFPAITEAGVAAIRQILSTELVDAPAPPPGPASGGGRLVWVAYRADGADGARVVSTPSGSYANLPAFVQRLDEAVSQNVRRAP